LRKSSTRCAVKRASEEGLRSGCRLCSSRGRSTWPTGRRPESKRGFEQDGDSIHFKPKKRTLLDRLERVGSPYRLTNIGSTQLRFEGIDALELHFRPDNGPESHQQRPLADESRNYLTGRFHLNPVPYVQPRGIRVDPPMQRDATPGYILSRALEAHGRPVAFASPETHRPPTARRCAWRCRCCVAVSTTDRC
jgi:hypothetical protein